MSELKKNLKDFVTYCKTHIKGDEKGEAQVFLERFFIALGHKDGVKGTGGSLEFRVKNEKSKTSFADFVWPKRTLIEMKKSGEDLTLHLQQATSYWLKLAGDRSPYVILCNFDEFWIYNFDKSVYEPVDKIKLTDLDEHYPALSFLLPKFQKPVFRTDTEDVTKMAAKHVASAFRSLCNRGIEKEKALRYCLQCIIAMFAEDIELLPDKIFTRIIDECVEEKDRNNLSSYDKIGISYDLIGGLFREMNTVGISGGERYRGVDYFNGGLFSEIYNIELTAQEVLYFSYAADKKWTSVNPAIFGSIFENALETDERHELGAHYTHEVDIKKIVDPCIVQPWLEKIDNAETLDEYYNLLDKLVNYKVLDPACGSGNFLFIAFKELKLIERRLLYLIRTNSKNPDEGKRLVKFLDSYPYVNIQQFYGLDKKDFAVELAKVTLMVAKELAWLDNKEDFDNKFKPLPLDNLDQNIICCDALIDENNEVREWPEADVIIGNPPYQSKNKMQKEFGKAYLNAIRSAYPEIPGHADFCVYWFYKAHKHLKPNAYAGLVGTNTIRQNYSREGSLDFIVHNGGTIINAVSSQKWSGDAVVYVSIVNWVKGAYINEKLLYTLEGKDEKLVGHTLELINSSLSLKIDVTSAIVLECNKIPKRVFQGQTHGHEGFLIARIKALKLIEKHPNYSDVLKPFLIGEEFLSDYESQPRRFVIDFTLCDSIKAASYKEIYSIVEKEVLPERREKAKKQEDENKIITDKNPKAKINKHHLNFYRNWWKLSWGRSEMLLSVSNINRYIICSRVALYPVFDFISSEIHPNDALMVFAFNDYYSFGIINSWLHKLWFIEKCSTLGEGPRYTTDSVWDTFPWPQNPTIKQVRAVSAASKELRLVRSKMLSDYRMGLRELYKTLEKPGENVLKNLHDKLDKAVIEAYGFDSKSDLLSQILDLNLSIAHKEENEEEVQAPGLPACVKNPEEFIDDECVKFIE